MTNPPSYLTDLPNASDFGQSFNYAVWTPDTQIELCNVPWNSDYRDIVNFDTQADLDAYLNTVAGPRVAITRLTLARAGDPVRINIPFNACYNYNYLRVNNGNQPINAKYVDPNGVVRTVTDTPRTLYYFIQDIQYLAPNTTQLTVMLDVWQTFGREVAFGNCYVERGHIGIANVNAMYNNGRDYMNAPEGLDMGPEYLINDTWRFQIPDNQTYVDSTDGIEAEEAKTFAAWIVIGIAADVNADPGDVNNPSLKTSPVLPLTDGMPNGFTILYFKSLADYKWFIQNFNEQPWITQSIMFITLIPPLDSQAPLGAYPVFDTSDKSQNLTRAWSLETNHTPLINRTIVSDFRTKAESFLPDRYKNLKKFLTSPYMWIELTTYNGAPLLLRPELIPDNDLKVDIYQHSAPPSPRWAIVPSHYNATGTGGDADDGEFLDIATYITNFPQFTVLNNNYLNYLASNRNSIHYAYTSADWSQQKALLGARTSIGNAEESQIANNAQSQIQQQANINQTDLANRNRFIHGAAGVVTGVMSGNPATALAEGVTAIAGTAMGVDTANRETAIRNNANAASTGVQNAYTQRVANRNYEFALSAAQGDYHNAINAVQARVQDAKMIQPTSVGQLGGESFIASIMGTASSTAGNFDDKEFAGWRIYAKLKQVDHGYMGLIGEYWLRYGYAINRFSNLGRRFNVMSKFTYWKLKETYLISSTCPEIYKQTIRGIFEKGVTVWVTPSDIGNIDIATNEPLSGIIL